MNYKTYIYKTTCLSNNKIYIGQRFEKRDIEKRENYLGSGILLQKAIKKYGKENFKKEIIEYCDNRNHANEMEIYWIAYFNSRDLEIGYNVALGGNMVCSMLNKKHTEETKVKMANWHMGKVVSQYTKEKISVHMTGLKRGKYNDAQGKKISEKLSGKSKSDEHRKNLSISHIGNRPGNSKYIAQIDPITNEILKVYNRGSIAAKEVKGAGGCRHAALNHTKTAGGYRWRYIQDLSENELKQGKIH